jgi:hypothetical protein
VYFELSHVNSATDAMCLTLPAVPNIVPRIHFDPQIQTANSTISVVRRLHQQLVESPEAIMMILAVKHVLYRVWRNSLGPVV